MRRASFRGFASTLSPGYAGAPGSARRASDNAYLPPRPGRPWDLPSLKLWQANSRARCPCYSWARCPCYSRARRPCYSRARCPCYSWARRPCYSRARCPCYSRARRPCCGFHTRPHASLSACARKNSLLQRSSDGSSLGLTNRRTSSRACFQSVASILARTCSMHQGGSARTPRPFHGPI